MNKYNELKVELENKVLTEKETIRIIKRITGISVETLVDADEIIFLEDVDGERISIEFEEINYNSDLTLDKIKVLEVIK